MRWYVYCVRSDGKLLYIGKGSNNRYLHSAKQRGGIAGILEYFKREKDAIKREIELIAEFTPPLNKTKGGEGNTQKRFHNYQLPIASMTAKAYKRADETGTWFDILVAAAFARIELNSRGIKGWPAEDPAQVLADPRVGEAIRRLHDWRLLPPPACYRSTISSV
jgi:hypothetical protein